MGEPKASIEGGMEVEVQSLRKQEIWGIMRKYEGNMKKYEGKYEGICRKYEGNMKQYEGNTKPWLRELARERWGEPKASIEGEAQSLRKQEIWGKYEGNTKPWLRELASPDPWRERYAYTYADTIPGMAPST